MNSEIARLGKKLAGFGALILILQAIVSLDYDWKNRFGILPRIAIPRIRYNPKPEILVVQQQQKLHPRLGFLWKNGIDESENVAFQWADQEAALLVTDENGFANAPGAITDKQNGRTVDVIGVGASFMQAGSSIFYDYFDLNGVFYYNMANQRFTLPQFNIVMEEYAAPVKPKWILYGLNEASYLLMDDFESWQKTGLDWFTYHSGTWCGPALDCGPLARRFPAMAAVVGSMRKKIGFKEIPDGPNRRLVSKATRYIDAAHKKAAMNGMEFLVVYIPNRGTVLQSTSSGAGFLDRMEKELAIRKIQRIDLRPLFKKVEDPSTLYYKSDGHWNRQGILLAGRAILNRIRDRFPADREKQ